MATYTEPLHDPGLAVPVEARAAEAPASFADSKSPLIVGVLGHRELDAQRVPRLRRAVAAFLLELEQYLPDSELRVIVGLTGGGDLLFVRGALERGLHVEIVLPETPDLCAADFTADDRAELHGLLKTPKVSSTVLPLPRLPASDDGNPDRESTLYTALTETLVRRSSILLTLWHGHSPPHGGIAAAAFRHVGVRADEDGADLSLVMLDLADDVDGTDSIVYWAPGASEDRAEAVTTRPRARMPPQLIRQLVDLNTYNLDFRRLSSRPSGGTVGSLLAHLPADLALQDRPGLEAVDAEYGKADALALHYQSRSDRLFGLFAATAFMMGLAYLTYDKLTPWRSLLIGYLVVLTCSLGFYYAVRGQRWFAKHLTYRALAETLRVTFYLRLAGIEQYLDAPRMLALSGINRFRGFSLITYVLTALAISDPHSAEEERPGLSRSRWVEREWIEGQYNYFVAKVARLRREGRRVKVLKNALFATIVGVIVAMALAKGVMEHYKIAAGISLKNIVTFVWGFLALLLGAWQLHDNNKASRELLLQYRNQGNHFSRARQQLSGLSDPAGRNRILIELGRDSLMESYLWTIHRYHREHEPVGRR